jgi:hypothetical protein
MALEAAPDQDALSAVISRASGADWIWRVQRAAEIIAARVTDIERTGE